MSLKQPKKFPKFEEDRLFKLTYFERLARSKGFCCLAGVDEAGRGPLAGPVVAAACVVQEGLLIPGVNDSKLLTPVARKHLFIELTTHRGVQFGIGKCDHITIDQINILQATLKAMQEAVRNLPIRPDYLLVDGERLEIEGISSERIIKGDQLSQSIAAASIIAKETRDQIMLEYHHEYPNYGFNRHKGYATEQHRQAIKKFGPCPIHRLTFATFLN